MNTHFKRMAESLSALEPPGAARTVRNAEISEDRCAGIFSNMENNKTGPIIQRLAAKKAAGILILMGAESAVELICNHIDPSKAIPICRKIPGDIIAAFRQSAGENTQALERIVCTFNVQ